jgi:hypothetical protein
MKVLLDECLPKRLKRELPGHDVARVQEMGWAGIKNGALIHLIQAADFEAFVTIDGNLEYQQNLRAINFAIIVLGAPDNTFDTLRPLMPQVALNVQNDQIFYHDPAMGPSRSVPVKLFLSAWKVFDFRGVRLWKPKKSMKK